MSVCRPTVIFIGTTGTVGLEYPLYLGGQLAIQFGNTRWSGRVAPRDRHHYSVYSYPGVDASTEPSRDTAGPTARYTKQGFTGGTNNDVSPCEPAMRVWVLDGPSKMGAKMGKKW